jgi:hypothetical protein
MDEKEEQKQLVSCYMKFLEDNIMRDGVKSIYHVHL